MQTRSATKIPTQLLSVQTWRWRATFPIAAGQLCVCRLGGIGELFQRRASAGILSRLNAALQLAGLMGQIWNLPRGKTGSGVVFGALAVLCTQPSHVTWKLSLLYSMMSEWACQSQCARPHKASGR